MTSPLTRPASLLLAAATLSASASAQFNFDECGTLVNDTIAQCVVFEADNGGTYLPSTSLGGLVIGDRVRAQGDVTGNFFTICGGTFSGLLLNETWTLAPQCNVVSDPITIFCDPASQHHEGAYVSLDPSTFGSGVGSDLHIEAINGPVDEFGFVIMSSDGSANLNIFNGVLCLGNPQGRYNPQVATNQALPQLNSLGQFDGAGVLQNMSGTSGAGSGFDVPTELPFSPAGQIIAPGDVYFFQVWYRDEVNMPGDSANFSNMIEVIY
jgi:hypothetical protein